jgi:hypothetical protein
VISELNNSVGLTVYLGVFSICIFYSVTTAAILKKMRAFSKSWPTPWPKSWQDALWVSPFLWSAPLLSLWNSAPTSLGYGLNVLFLFGMVLACLFCKNEVLELLADWSWKNTAWVGLVLLAFLGVHFYVGSLAPLSIANNDAYWYIPAVEYFSSHSIPEAPAASPIFPSYFAISKFGLNGSFRAGFVVVAAHIQGLLQAMGLSAYAIHVVPAVSLFFITVAALVSGSVSIRVFGITLPWALLGSGLFLLSQQVQRLYWESFFPACFASMAMTVCFFSLLSILSQPFKKANQNTRPVFILTALWVWIFWGSYPEALFYFGPLFIGFIYLRFKSFKSWRGFGQAFLYCLGGVFAGSALGFVAMARYFSLFKNVISLQRGDVALPWLKIPFYYTIGLGQGYYYAFYSDFDSYSWLIAFCIGAAVLYQTIRGGKLRTSVLFYMGVLLPAVLSYWSVARRNEYYSATRIFELIAFSVPFLFGFFAKTINEGVSRVQLHSRWIRSDKWVSGGVFCIFLIVLMATPGVTLMKVSQLLKTSKLFPKETDFQTLMKVEPEKKLGLVGAASGERSLFLSHFYMTYLDLYRQKPYAFAQHPLSYFLENAPNPAFSSPQTWINTESLLVVSKQDCMNKDTPDPQYIPRRTGWIIVPLDDRVRFFRSPVGQCQTRLSKPSQLLIVGPPEWSSNQVMQKVLLLGSFKMEVFGQSKPGAEEVVFNPEKKSMILNPQDYADRAVMLTTEGEAILMFENLK